MPTPSDNRPTSIAEVISTRTCPPELDRVSAWRDSPDSTITASEAIEDALTPASATAPSVLSRSDDGSALLASDPLKVESKMPGATDDETTRERSSSPTELCARSRSPVMPPNSSLLRYEFSNVRVSLTAQYHALRHTVPSESATNLLPQLLPNHSSSYLRSGSRFIGTQMSDKQVYNVDVEIKHVDMAESYLCGDLRIQGQ